MIRFVIFSNFIAAIAGVIASSVFVSQSGLKIFPVLLYFGLLGLPGIFANFILFGVFRGFRVAALALHFFALVVLGILFVLAWVVSLGSGAAASPFVFAAGLINCASIIALKKMANSVLERDAPKTERPSI